MKIRTNKLIGLCLLTAGLVAMPAVSLSAKQALGIVVYKQGRVYLYRRGQGRKSMRKNMLVQAGDRIVTGRRGSLSLQFKTGVIFRIGKGSSITITDLQKRSVAMRMKNGSIAGRVKAYGVKIVTPTTIAGVRGTDFIVEASAKQNNAKVMVNKGVVDVTNNKTDTTQPVSAGNKIVSDQNGMQSSIMEQFEKQKFEIFQKFEAVKKANVEMLIELKRKNRELIEKQRKIFR